MVCGQCSVHFRRLVGVGVMVAFLATAVPAMAAPQAQPSDSAFSKKSIAKVVANTTPTPAATKPQAQATKQSGFFKSRTGVLVLVAMAVGTGYALYSAKEDRIKGSIR